MAALGLMAGPAAGQLGRGTSAPLGQFDVAMSVSPASFGQMRARIINVRSEGNAVFGKLAIENAGHSKAVMKDFFRTSAWARGGSGKQLLAADDGCGWSYGKPGTPVHPGVCQLDLRTYTLHQDETAKLGISATRGLNGMRPLSAGHYEFDREVKFRIGDGKLPPSKAHLVVSFDVTRLDQ
jgi:hypothetical protein